MDFKKKLKTRLFLSIACIVSGLAMLVIFNIIKAGNNFLTSFALGLTVVGIARVRNYFLITKNDESIRKQEIAETDERNIAIVNQAQSISFIIYIMLTVVAITVLHLFDQTLLATTLSVSFCILLIIYLISYWIINKRS